MLFRKNFDFQVLSTTLMGAVSDVIKRMTSEKFSRQPVCQTRPIILTDEEDVFKMKVSGFYKYLGRCLISVIQLYKSPRDMEKKKMCGTVILYAKQSCAIQLARALNMTKSDKVSDEALSDMIGEFCNIVVGSFKNALSDIGYVNLTLSAPENYFDEISEGIPFDLSQEDCQEYRFAFWGEDVFVIDVILAPLPRKR